MKSAYTSGRAETKPPGPNSGRQGNRISSALLHGELFFPQPGIVTLEQLVICTMVFGEIHEVSDGLVDLHVAQRLLLVEVFLANVETVLFRILNNLLDCQYPEYIPGGLLVQIKIIIRVYLLVVNSPLNACHATVVRGCHDGPVIE